MLVSGQSREASREGGIQTSAFVVAPVESPHGSEALHVCGVFLDDRGGMSHPVTLEGAVGTGCSSPCAGRAQHGHGAASARSPSAGAELGFILNPPRNGVLGQAAGAGGFLHGMGECSDPREWSKASLSSPQSALPCLPSLHSTQPALQPPATLPQEIFIEDLASNLF